MKPEYTACSACQCTKKENGFSAGLYCIRTPDKIHIRPSHGCWMGIKKDDKDE